MSPSSAPMRTSNRSQHSARTPIPQHALEASRLHRSWSAIVVRAATVGARLPFDFSETEVAGFQTIANTVGVMLEHYRIFHGSVMKVATSSSVAIAMTGVEIAQIARHEARNGIDRIQLVLTDVDRYLSRRRAEERRDPALRR